MRKIVTMHQPNYLPWVGLFSKVSQANCLVIYDTAQYTNGGVTNRNKIRTDVGWCYLTIPLSRRFFEARILDITLPEDRRWQRDHWKTLSQYYARAAYFRDHRGWFEQLYAEEHQYLWQINEKIIRYLLGCFGTEVDVIRASELNVDPCLKATDMITACMKRVGADIYLSGPSGRDYLEEEKFTANGIGLKFFKFEHPVYKQRYSGFEPNMSAIDLLFNMGPGSGQIIRASGTSEDALNEGAGLAPD